MDLPFDHNLVEHDLQGMLLCFWMENMTNGIRVQCLNLKNTIRVHKCNYQGGNVSWLGEILQYTLMLTMSRVQILCSIL